MSTQTPWNKERAVGQRKAFEPGEVRAIVDYLATEDRIQELCLFTLGIDTMLRAGDLLALRVDDIVIPGRSVDDSLSCLQTKTKHGVHPVLTPASRQAAADWIAESGKRPADFLFTGHKPIGDQAISETVFRRLVKSWADAIGLDSRRYSTHSLRRTKAIHLYRSGVSVECIAKLLGHKDTKTTLVYLGVTLAQAQDEARRHDLFQSRAEMRQPRSRPSRVLLSEAEIDRVAGRVADLLLPRLTDCHAKRIPPENLDNGGKIV